MRKTYLFLYNDLNIGGIQKNLINIARELKKNNHRIIWVTTNREKIDIGYIEDAKKMEIYQYDSKKYHGIDSIDIKFYKNEEIIGMAFSYREYCFLLRIRKKIKINKFSTILWIPHFEGAEIFFENFFPQPLRFLMKYHMKSQYKKLDENDNIFYVNMAHVKGLSSNYNFSIQNIENKIYTKPIFTCKREFYSEKVKNKFKSCRFNILTVSRFSFPHKGYILGLIREFNNLQKKYPYITLTIAGYGKHENVIKNEIKSLPSDVQNKIFVIGKVEYDKLDAIFDKANIFIGVAGAVSDASRTGLISIPVRHNVYTCEGYGYSFERSDMLTSTVEGEDIKIFIEKVLNMTESEYLFYSKKTFDFFNPKDYIKIGEHTLNLKNKDDKVVISLYLENLVERCYCFLLKFKSFKKLVEKINER